MLKKSLAALAVVFMLAGMAFAGAWDDAQSTYEDTSTFDGGSGSTINTSPSSYDSGDYSSVPDIGDAGPVGYYDENGNYHSY